MTIMDEYDRMRTAMEYATGQTLDTDHPTRTYWQFWMRAIIAYTLWNQGWIDERIAPVLGRDRASIWYSRQRVMEALELPRVYADVVETIKQFKAQYYELFGTDI